jgi:hypothetical protein
MVVPAWRAGRRRLAWKGLVRTERPFGEPQSSEEPYDVELRRACERDRGRQAIALPCVTGYRELGSAPALAVTRDGALLVANDTGGTIWRIAYTGQRDAAQKDERKNDEDK